MADVTTPDTVANRIESIPAAIEPPFPVGEPGAAVVLYDSKATITVKGKTFEAPFRIELDWLPSPRIRCLVPPHTPQKDIQKHLFSMFMSGPLDASLVLDDGTQIDSVSLGLGQMASLNTTAPTFTLRGIVEQLVRRGTSKDAHSVRFLIPNFDSPSGEPIRVGRSLTRGRNRLLGGNWTITLDEIEHESKIVADLRSNSGFAFTAVGKAERPDGRLISADDAIDLMQALNWYLSFASGRWVGPCLVRGYSADETPVWEAWHLSRVDPYRNVRSWVNGHPNGQLSGPFAGFMPWWAGAEWKEVLTNAIHWFIEANKQAGSIEGAIVLTQTAFELLSSVVLVEREGWLSSDGAEKLPAADRIRLLFRWVGLPTEIPSSCNELTRLAKAENYPDIPSVMTTIRNTITHPTKKSRQRFERHSDDARIEAWCLGLWALELCLLRLCGYRGTYSNRITHTHAWEQEPVPWAK